MIRGFCVGTNYYRKGLKISFIAKIRTSQGGDSDGPLTFATRSKRAGARVRYITRRYYRGFSDHSNMSWEIWTMYYARLSGSTISKMTQEGDGYNARTSGASP